MFQFRRPANDTLVARFVSVQMQFPTIELVRNMVLDSVAILSNQVNDSDYNPVGANLVFARKWGRNPF